MVEQTLVNVIQEAYVLGVSTRKVDDLVKAMGLEGIDKSQVSRLCQELDERVQQFRNRRLDSSYPYLWLDATYVNVRTEGRVVSIAVVVAVAVNEDGQREVIGFAAGPAESEGFWLDFLRSLVERGLKGVLLVVSDAHAGLRKAIKTVLTGAAWQRCRVHFMRNILSVVTKAAQSAVSAAVRTIFQQPDIESARAQLGRVAEGLRDRFPRVTERLYEAQEDVLAYMSFPEQHRRRLHSTNTLERLNKEIKRRTNVVQIFPNVSSLVRLIGAILSEQNDEWLVGKRYFSIGCKV